jgi:thiosulfate/3-mercaptopyruvate sulfurtransferase
VRPDLETSFHRGFRLALGLAAAAAATSCEAGSAATSPAPESVSPAAKSATTAPDPAGETELPTLLPSELATLLATQGRPRPLLLHVGFRKLYQQAHIPGSEYVGPTSSPGALAALRTRVKDLERGTSVVVYCGCCPWDRCPNVRPVAHLLRELGFENARLLLLPQSFDADWVARGYPIASGD